MFSDHAENQVFGEDALNLGLIAGAAFLLLATLWTGATPPASAVQPSAQAAEQVVVVAHRARVTPVRAG